MSYSGNIVDRERGSFEIVSQTSPRNGHEL
jgi:hypothetical protein